MQAASQNKRALLGGEVLRTEELAILVTNVTPGISRMEILFVATAIRFA